MPKLSETNKSDCFKCNKPLSGVILVLGTGKGPFWYPEFPAHLRCLDNNICIFGGEVLVSRKGKNSWQSHRVEKRKQLFYTYVRTMMDTNYSTEGRVIDKMRYCNSCNVDCGFGTVDEPFFYCADVFQKNLLWLKCNKCFMKLGGDWKCEAQTAPGSIINRNVPSVYLYCSVKVYEDSV